MKLDALDVRLLRLLDENPRVGVLELSRLAGVARATVSARMQRWQGAGVVTGYGPQLDLEAAGFPVQALATLEIAQGQLSEISEFLSSLPGVIEAYATTGTGDVVCRLAAASNADLQDLLLRLNESDAIRRSTSVVILSTVVAPRVIPLLVSSTPMRSGALVLAAATGWLSRPPQPPRAATRSHRARVYAIGDSVMIDAKHDLRHDISGIVVDADVSRQVDAGIRILQRQKRNNTIAQTTVFGLGTNGTFTRAQLKQRHPAHRGTQARRDHDALPVLRLDGQQQPDGSRAVHARTALLDRGIPGARPRPSEMVHRRRRAHATAHRRLRAATPRSSRRRSGQRADSSAARGDQFQATDAADAREPSGSAPPRASGG